MSSLPFKTSVSRKRNGAGNGTELRRKCEKVRVLKMVFVIRREVEEI
jgi:hypothetical protein